MDRCIVDCASCIGCDVISGYETYVILDATRGISIETINTALVAMKQSGMSLAGLSCLTFVHCVTVVWVVAVFHFLQSQPIFWNCSTRFGWSQKYPLGNHSAELFLGQNYFIGRVQWHFALDNCGQIFSPVLAPGKCTNEAIPLIAKLFRSLFLLLYGQEWE